MRTLVTGGAGFIGSDVVDALVERGDEVTVLDDVSTGRRENLDQALAGDAELVDGDIRDGEAVGELCDRVRPEAIFHLAAQIDVRKSVADPAFGARVNVEGTINVLRAAQATGVRRVVNTSSGGAIYGEGQTIPAPEDHPVAPEAPYGQSKFCAECYCDLFGRLHGLSTISLRYGNVYGPRQDPLGEAGVIAIFCGKLLAGERPTIFGDGRQTRDYIYVADFVAADLTDREAVLRAVDGVEAVVHLGAIRTETSFDQLVGPNVLGTFNVFDAARRAGVRRVVYASSNHATGFYPVDQRLSGVEPPRPDGLYGTTKAFGEALGRMYSDRFGLEVICLRIGSFAERP